MALSFSFFSKAMTGSYMKSSITQIERRFDLSTSHVGLIDGSFEMGNLLLLAVVSHFGAKLHRPRLIAAGCTLMAVGSLLTGLTHFFMGRYEYSSVVQVLHNDSVSVSFSLCLIYNSSSSSSSSRVEAACVRDSGSSMWVYVFLGNALRGIGESPVTPLGISYIDDFAEAENSPFYIGTSATIAVLGPMFGFLLGSLCAKLYVDIGFVDMDSVSITPKDSRWVGAWWLGFLVCSSLLLISSIPFWFLPRSLSKAKPAAVSECRSEPFLDQKRDLKLKDIAKAFLPSLKRLLGTPTYFLLVCGSVLRANSLIGLITFAAKYIEQQFGQSASRANFLIGVLNLPAVALGIFLGGLLMKRYKLSIVSGAQLSFASSFMAYLLLLLQFGTKCENIPVAGLTISYNGSQGGSLLSDCNSDCMCSSEEWDPVCSDSGITYVSPCLAGCISSSGYGKNTVFNNCSCVDMSYPAGSSSSVKLGQCPHAKDCTRSFKSYMAVSVLSSFIASLGITPGYMVIIRSAHAQLRDKVRKGRRGSRCFWIILSKLEIALHLAMHLKTIIYQHISCLTGLGRWFVVVRPGWAGWLARFGDSAKSVQKRARGALGWYSSSAAGVYWDSGGSRRQKRHEEHLKAQREGLVWRNTAVRSDWISAVNTGLACKYEI
uniref:Solute carrier organic anion transporter family member n=1 Tax=Periophthalmus magnuspinnatus TaxID=409849 RepID=A0A3B4AE23_9GOBI